MAETDFPKMLVQPGEYPAEWYYDGQVFAGECDLRPLRPALAVVHGSMKPDGSAVRHYPRTWSESYLTGRLRSGHDVELADCHVSAWPGALTDGEQNQVGARWAIVGVGTRSIPDRRYDRIRLQLSGLDEFFLTSPVGSYVWPRQPIEGEQREGTETLKERIAGQLNPDRNREWIQEGITLRCGYEHTMPMSGYQIAATFAPIISIDSDSPLDLDTWISHWVQPLLRLVTFATRTRQDVAWMTVHRRVPDDHHPLGEATISGQVFGGGISQVPFSAQRPEPRQGPDRPLLSLPDLPAPLPQLVRRWFELDGADSHPFVELFRLVLFTPDLPERARCLYLTQALEALHATEHAEEDADRERLHVERRSEVLQSLGSIGLDQATMKFIKKNLTPRPLASLESRLKPLIDDVDAGLEDMISDLERGGIGQRLAEKGATSFPDMVRLLRNHLSHGSQNYPAHELKAWSEALARVAEHHLIRLLVGESPGPR